jgi:hypothetical protein
MTEPEANIIQARRTRTSIREALASLIQGASASNTRILHSTRTQDTRSISAAQAAVSGYVTPPNRSSPLSTYMHSQFQAKTVCKLFCGHCKYLLCERGMRAILLGNVKKELFSTDIPPSGVQLVYQDYFTKNCGCRIRDSACLECGNMVGYHVTQPCGKCLDSCNNGHLWIFQADGLEVLDRVDLPSKHL